MDATKLSAVLILTLLCVSCATSKSINNPEDIGDDGKRNTVFMTYDIKLYTTNRYPTVSSTSLLFRCPKNSAGFGGSCFKIKTPFLGKKEVDGYQVNAFEKSGSEILQMKYGDHLLQSIQHSVVVDRVPELSCYTSKKTKKRTCRTIRKDVTNRHSSTLQETIAISVSAGPGCYLGHLAITMFEGEITYFELTNDEPLTVELLSDYSPELAAAIYANANLPCY